jgi:vacuolar-type H+-ATPase subunit E/Vma4
MLQQMQYTDWTRFMEKQWEFQGVTPEMIRRQRQQTEALQSMIRIADDNSALDMVLERYRSLVDADFFALLDRLLMVASQQQDRASLERVVQLRNRLKETTEVGRKIQIAEDKVRALIDSITQETTPAEIIVKLTAAAGEPDGEQIAASVMMAISPAIDYQFLLAVTEKLEASSDEAERKALELLRSTATRIQEQVQASRQSIGAQLQELLQTVLQSEDPQATLNEYGDLIDENFLGLLASNIDRAEKSGATGAARRFRQLYEMALNVVQQGMPPEVQLLNDLVNAPDQATMRRLLDENRSAITREFIESLRQLEDDFRQRGNPELADRIKSVRAAATLMQ